MIKRRILILVYLTVPIYNLQGSIRHVPFSIRKVEFHFNDIAGKNSLISSNKTKNKTKKLSHASNVFKQIKVEEIFQTKRAHIEVFKQESLK